jgi:DtxR family Mn-dependent transcriptional regulator
MLKKLAENGYSKLAPYSKIFLTSKGLKEARRVMHNHRVIEVFLKKILKYDLSKVHEEAHRLEHAFSEEAIKRLDKFLNHPTRSPHGYDIPHED